MRIDAVFFDIDGTLVDLYTRQIPKSTLISLNELREKGIKLFVCSGRNPEYRKQLDKEIPFTFDNYIFMNGQWITDKNGKCIYSKSFDYSTKEELYRYFQNKPEIFITVYSDLGEYTNSAKTNNPFISPNPRDLSNILKENVYELTAFQSQKDDKEVEKIKGCKCARWGCGTDIIPVDGGKDVGIKALLKMINIDQRYTMAFGDGQNDIAMFNEVNISVAMAEASKEVISSATMVTDKVMNDGIYKALKKKEVI